MGRELKRVPLNFDWPIGTTWTGYINPHYTAKECQACGGDGLSADGKRLKDLWYGYVPFRPEDRDSEPFTVDTPQVWAFAERNVRRSPLYYGTGECAIRREAERLSALFNGSWSHHLNDGDVAALVEAGRLYDLTHTFKAGEGWKPKEPPYTPTAREVNLWSIGGMGHDSVNQWKVCSAEAARLNVCQTCASCAGEGSTWPSKDDKDRYEAWAREDPPEGDAYQIWQTVSEGSPISPPFATPEELAEHMATTRWGADKGTSYETWLAFIRGPGWAPSFVGSARGLQDGVSAVVETVS